MNSKMCFRWAVLICLNVLAWGVLSFQRAGVAAPPSTQPPFANAVEQRFEIISQLKQMNELLKEQNALLRSGALKVQLVAPK